jgi:hypothetical protein
MNVAGKLSAAHNGGNDFFHGYYSSLSGRPDFYLRPQFVLIIIQRLQKRHITFKRNTYQKQRFYFLPP